jgi:ankyrin repeat protein
MSQTRGLLDAALPIVDLTDIIWAYFATGKNDNAYELAKSGEWEALSELSSDHGLNALTGACKAGFVELVHALVDCGADRLDWGLYSACRSNQTKIAQFMIDRGSRRLDTGLYAACFGGHHETIQLMIDNGATNWNSGLTGACCGGQTVIVQFMISKGATFCGCGKTIAKHLKT